MTKDINGYGEKRSKENIFTCISNILVRKTQKVETKIDVEVLNQWIMRAVENRLKMYGSLERKKLINLPLKFLGGIKESKILVLEYLLDGTINLYSRQTNLIIAVLDLVGLKCRCSP